jgi:hypothetical protein
MARCTHTHTVIGYIMPLKPKDNPAPDYHEEHCRDCHMVREVERVVTVTPLEKWHR